MQKVVAVIPAHNEQDRIGKVIERAWDFVDDIIAVDDCSSDKTAAIAKDKGAHVIKLAKNMGTGFATRTGCDYAIEKGADIIITIDADGQHSPNDMPRLLTPVIGGDVDIVFGIRPRDSRMPFGKRVANVFLSFFVEMLFGSDIKDTLTGFHAFKKESYQILRWDSSGYEVGSEIVYRTLRSRLKYKQVLVQTIYNEKKEGMRKRDGMKSILFMIKWKISRH